MNPPPRRSFLSRCITFALSRCSGGSIIEAVWNIMNGWYSRVDETPWERRKERSLGTETGKFITKFEFDSGNKGEIPEGERWKTAEDSVSSKRSENADVLCRKENCVCRPAAASSYWPPVHDWDDGRNIRQRWGWRGQDHDQRPLTCPQRLPVYRPACLVTVRLLVEAFLTCCDFYPTKTPCAMFSTTHMSMTNHTYTVW